MYSARTQDVAESSNFCLEKTAEDSYQLKKTHAYYYQVCSTHTYTHTVLLAFVAYGYRFNVSYFAHDGFIVILFCGPVNIERIYPEVQFWLDCVKKARLFFKCCLA